MPIEPRRPRPSLVASALAAVAALPLLAATGSSTDASRFSQQDVEALLSTTETVYYPVDNHPFRESALNVVDGELGSYGACTFSFQDTLAPNEIVQRIERAYDPSTCTSVFEVGIPIDGQNEIRHVATGLGVSEQTAAITAGTEANPNAFGGVRPYLGRFDPAGYTIDVSTPKVARQSGVDAVDNIAGEMIDFALNERHVAWSHSWYDDPPRWLRNCDVDDPCFVPPVNTVYNSVEWVPDGSCALKAGETGHSSYRLTWLAETGWEMTHHNWDHSPSVVYCPSNIRSKSFATFENVPFCVFASTPIPIHVPLDPVWTDYSPNGVAGQADGSATHVSSLTKGGAWCSAMLQAGDKKGHHVVTR